MIQIATNMWVDRNSIVRVYVHGGKLCLELTSDATYTVEAKFLGSVCASLNIEYSTVQGLLCQTST